MVTPSKVGESAAAAGISSNPRLASGPVVGGVVGSIGLVTIVALIFWFFRRRRRNGREPWLRPLSTGRGSHFYEIDNGSVGPTGRGKKWKAAIGYRIIQLRKATSNMKTGVAGIGASLKSKVIGERSDTPSVNLNRGNSQFLDGPVSQHSRNNSVLSRTDQSSVKDKFSDWWERFTENVSFEWRVRKKSPEPDDPFAAARGMTEKQAKLNGTPDFSQLLRMDEGELEPREGKRRASLVGNKNSFPQLGSLGLDFGSMGLGDDPFADPIHAWKPPKPGTTSTSENPFADPVTRPAATIPKANTQIVDIRRSRGQSTDATTNANNASTYLNNAYRPPSTAVASRYPSSIAASHDSYRDTVFSSFSTNARKGKGRSDPFDLERPDLWRPRDPHSTTSSTIAQASPYDPARMSALRSPQTGAAENEIQIGRVSVAQPRVISTNTFTSRYSSGASSLAEWGDPGPDLGPQSGNSSLRGDANGMAMYDDMASQRRQAEWGSSRNQDNVSPVSLMSTKSRTSKGSVGKAL